jgi:hypothetical protein
MMRAFGYNLLLIIGLALTLGLSTAIGASDNDNHRPKGTGTLSVKTSPEAMPVKIDGQFVGMSGVGTGAEFYLSPGFHTVEVTAPDGKIWTNEVEIRRDHKNCVCLKFVTETITTPCPYRFHLEGPDRITEGDLVTFSAINSGTAPVPLRYAWTSNGRITSGLGTPTITIDSTGMGDQTINAELDVNDDTYDNKCRQVISVPTQVTRIRVEPPQPFRCDEFEARTHDADKAHFDNCVIQVQNTPDAQLYVIIYPGTDRRSRANAYERQSKFLLDYMVRTRGLDPRRIQIIKGPERQSTTYVLWVVPPGATLPVP